MAADDSATVEATAESDLGVGDASAHVRIAITYVLDGADYVYDLGAWVAVVDRTLASITLTGEGTRVSDLDPVEELGRLVESS